MGISVGCGALLPFLVTEEPPDGQFARPALFVAFCAITGLTEEATKGAWGRYRAGTLVMMIPDSHGADAPWIVELSET